MGPNGIITPYEDNPELIWPLSAVVYDKMRRTDGQVQSVLRAIGLLIRQTGWKTMGADVDDRVNAFVDADLGLQTDQEGQTRKSQNGFIFDDFLRHALLSGPIGHSIFEQTYDVNTVGKDPLTGLTISAHLANLSWRPHRTISQFVTNSDGSLKGIKQFVQNDYSGVVNYSTVFIPAENLVVFCNDREGSDWSGQSWLRSCWFNWNTKVKLTILDAIGIERNSVGVPVFEHPSDMKSNEALGKAQQLRGGENSAFAYPYGEASLKLLGVQGSTREVLPSIQYHNEEIGRSLLAMVLNLGHDRGAQSLGETFYDLFCISLNAITADICSVVTEHVIRPLVQMNFGEDEPYPALVADDIAPHSNLDPIQLKALVDAGVIVPDSDLEEDQRAFYKLPPAESQGVPVEDVQSLPTDQTVEALPQGPLAASRGPNLDVMRAKAEELTRKIRARQEAEAR